MSFAALAFSGERMARQLRVYSRTPDPTEKPTARGRKRSEKYVTLCEKLLERIAQLGKAEFESIQIEGASRLEVRRALWFLRQDETIVYQGHAPHGYWRVKVKGRES